MRWTDNKHKLPNAESHQQGSTYLILHYFLHVSHERVFFLQNKVRQGGVRWRAKESFREQRVENWEEPEALWRLEPTQTLSAARLSTSHTHAACLQAWWRNPDTEPTKCKSVTDWKKCICCVTLVLVITWFMRDERGREARISTCVLVAGVWVVFARTWPVCYEDLLLKLNKKDLETKVDE